MSENSIDRRAVATRRRIGDAFLRLGGTRSLDAISVRDLAREAGIARSTFYAHYSGYEDYLARSFAAMLAGLASRGSQSRVLPVDAIVEHVAMAGEGARRLARYKHFAGMMAEGERALRRVAEARLTAQEAGLDPVDRALMATMLAAGFLAMLRDWMLEPRSLSAGEVARRFNAMEERLVGN